MRFGRRTAQIAGALSGLFGGLVGNQGGIRSAGLLGFDLPKERFVAAAAATEWRTLVGLWPWCWPRAAGGVYMLLHR